MSHTITLPTAGLPPLTADDLPDDRDTLKSMLLEALASLRESRHDNVALRQRLEQMIQRMYGRRGERFDPDQQLLFESEQPPATPAAPPAEPAEPATPKPKCQPHGRRRLPENLPREPKHHELTLAERLCARCGSVRVEIGMDKSEQLDYKPASLFVVEHFVHKYACPCCAEAARQRPPEIMCMTTPEPDPSLPVGPEHAASPSRPAEAEHAVHAAAAASTPTPAPGQANVAAAPAAASSAGDDKPKVVIAAAKPAMPIAKGLPGPGLLAHLIVSKFTDHLPLHRLERIYERQGVLLPRSTLCDWLLACGQLLRPLYDVMLGMMLQSRSLHTDDTPIKMQDPKTHILTTARMWAYLGDDAHRYNLFDFTINRKRDGPQQFLASYRGYLHADAFSGYDCLYLPDPRTTQARIIEVACNAHARRKFYEARSSDALHAHRALAYYGQLYELERQAKDFSESQRLALRQELSLPILGQFRAWLEQVRGEALPKSPLGEAVGYALNNWDALKRYTEAGFLDIDNNAAEREMKRIAIGRKNWLFVGSRRGGETAAVLMSFTSTCHRLGVEPWAYLQDVLTRLPGLPAGQLDALLPDRWQAEQRAKQATPPTAVDDGSAPSPASDS